MDYIVAIDIKFVNLPSIRISTSTYDLTIGGHEFKAVGDVLSISESKVQKGIKTNTTKVTIAGEASEYIQAINDNAYIGGSVKIIMAEVNDDGTVNNSYTLSSGVMSKPSVSKTTSKIKIDIEVIPIFINLEKATGTLPIDSLHQVRSSGDTIFEYVPEARSLLK